MAFLLYALLLLVVWALWYVLNLFYGVSLWIPIAASVVIVLLAVALFVIKRIRMARAANALESAIAGQGQQQALNARPEKRAEIQELQKQVSSGISALKKSKLGAGKKSGAAALYSLPWYVIIGPPGAGKTTALKHSGLVFPYADPTSGGGVRGVGGTRNCDWWFTNEAILLDTAGRYTTEADDRDEWIAFLQMLRKYRSRQPLNGILVAISVADLIDANEQQIEAMGKKVRARVDEVMTQLHMRLPVYVLFTKCDLIAGFTDFFGDMRKSDRGQPWGTTFRLDMPMSEPSRLFDAEFDVLVKQVHARSIKRMVMERSREARERLFQFPLEFAGIKRNLSELLGHVFMVNAFQGTPIFRGFYFTSGTQEGKPLNRVLGRMGQAMGIRLPEQAVQQVVESKSYFLHDVFMNVVFPDANVAARSESEVRRQMLMRIAVAGAAGLLAFVIAVPSIISFVNNRRFLKDSEQIAVRASTITWDTGPAPAKLDLMDPVVEKLREIDKHKDEGVPISMSMWMYQGEEVRRPLQRVFVKTMQDGFVVPTYAKLEARLKTANGDKYLKERQLLKTYMMLGAGKPRAADTFAVDPKYIDVEWATGELTTIWAESLRQTTTIPEPDLKKRLRPHVQYDLELLKRGDVQPVPLNKDLVVKTQKMLQAVPIAKRYYEVFVNTLLEEKYNPAGDLTADNLKYPPITLQQIFTDRPRVMKHLESDRYKKEKRWQEVQGPYTEKGLPEVLANISEGRGWIEREEWVVPLSEEEKDNRIDIHLTRLRDDYNQNFIDQWTSFMLDIKVIRPATMKDAIETYGALIEPDWPVLRVVRKLQDNTRWKNVGLPQNKLATDEANRRLEQYFTMKTGGYRMKFDVAKFNEMSGAQTVPNHFKRTVEFAVPPDKGPANVETSLGKYIGLLDSLRTEMIRIDNPQSGIDPRSIQEKLVDAAKQTDALFQPYDERCRTLLAPLLLDPLQILGAPKLAPAGQGRVGVQPSRFGFPNR